MTETPPLPATPCVLWTGRINADGYGTIGIRLAHRAAWTDVNGPIPKGLELDHLCRVRACIRLDHLEPVTHAENIRRAQAYRVQVLTCPRGHFDQYTLGSNGRRHCRACKRERSREAHVPPALGDDCGKGHQYDRPTAKGVRCSVCMSINGKAAMASRWHGK